MAKHLRLRTVASDRNIAFGNGPVLVSDFTVHRYASLRHLSRRLLSPRDSPLHKFPNPVTENRHCDLRAVGLASCQRFREFQCLVSGNLAWQWRLKGIDDSLQHRWAPLGKELLHRTSAVGGVVHGKSCAATRMGHFGKINRMQIDAVFRISKEN